jgi:hypothetical protein
MSTVSGTMGTRSNVNGIRYHMVAPRPDALMYIRRYTREDIVNGNSTVALP